MWRPTSELPFGSNYELWTMNCGRKKLAVIAFGGNALLRTRQKGTYQEQIDNVAKTCRSLTHLIKRDYNLIIGHGNGPQVGNVMLQHEAGNQVFDLQVMPMDFCVAETQGSIGYMIEQGMRNVLLQEQIERNVVTLVTEVLVAQDDPMFHNPTKPVGPYYTEEEADEFAEKTGAVYRADPKGIGWRKVVASPKPLQIINIEIVAELIDKGYIVVTVGGGGIPVIKKENCYYGVEAVIDKDLASALTAVQVGAEEFYILTDVPKVYINFKKENEQAIDKMTVAEAKHYLDEGQFTEGSMAPKVRAAIYFVEQGGDECIITEAGELENPNAGTRIVRE
jgi:carbamate kinase